MDFVSLRLWQWIGIGVVAGGLVGFSQVGVPTNFRTDSADQFRGYVNARRAASTTRPTPAQQRFLQRPPPARLSNIVVHQPERDPSGKDVYTVTYDRTTVDRNNQETTVSRAIYARVPFGDDANVLAYLKKQGLPFSDRTGSGRYIPVYYGAAGGALVIGLLWPGVIQLMIRAGLATKPPPKEKKVKTAAHRTGEDVDDMLVKDADRSVKAGDIARLDALNSEMEQRLAAGLSPGDGKPRAGAAPADEPVSVLMSGGGSRSTTDPTVAAPPPKPEDPKDFKGEYYPVARPHKRDDDHDHK